MENNIPLSYCCGMPIYNDICIHCKDFAEALDECLVTPSEIQEVEATEPTEERGG